MDSVAGRLQSYLSQARQNPEHAALDLQALPEEFREFGNTLVSFSQCVAETGALAKAIAKGNLSAPLPPPENELAAPLKALHASLRHLTWQAQQVAQGDYQQRVDFMGDFSLAFNTMVEQLEQRHLALLEQIHTMVQSRSLYEMLEGQLEQRIIVTDADTTKLLFASSEMDSALAFDDCETGLCRWLKTQAKVMKGRSEKYVTELELANEGSVLCYSVSIHPLCWNQHNALAFVLTDISEEKMQLKRLQDIANIDTLTRLYNRRYGMEMLEEWLAESRSFVLCFVDIDNLKFVNDWYGHAEGDTYIARVSAALREFSPEAVPCRVGGDEFILLAEDWAPETAEERMELLRSRLIGGDSPYERSISYGVIAVGPENTLRMSELLNVVDEKMYEYKRVYKLQQRNRQRDKDV